MKRLAIEGHRFSRLIVLERCANIGVATAYTCKCDCGNVVNVRGQCLRNGMTKSCGCFKSEKLAALQTRHGHYNSPTYHSWCSMHARCKDTKHKQFKDYGGRGIAVCASWKQFTNFLADMGVRPDGMTLDRINSDGMYESINCRWATRLEQNRNKRNSHKGAIPCQQS